MRENTVAKIFDMWSKLHLDFRCKFCKYLPWASNVMNQNSALDFAIFFEIVTFYQKEVGKGRKKKQ